MPIHILHTLLTVTVEMELGIPDLLDVRREVFKACPKWYDVGLELRVPVHTLDSIRIQFTDPADCLRETLKQWLKGIDPKPTWSALVDALRSDAVGEHCLARELEEKYLPAENRRDYMGRRNNRRARVTTISKLLN